MQTDWALVREMMMGAIDACERLEALGLGEEDRYLTGEANGSTASVFDALTGAWTYPESVRYRLIAERSAAGVDRAYLPESARILRNVAEACAELVGAGEPAPGAAEAREMVRWYSGHLGPLLEDATRSRPAPV